MILVAVGANLAASNGEGPQESCERAVGVLRKLGDVLAGMRFGAVSNWYRTTAMPVSDQPDYCNGVVRLEGEVAPVALLAKLQEIEALFGRERGVLNAARTLDLDIIDINGLVRGLADPVLPHPRAHLRAFVLRPLLDVAPDWVHPVFQRPVTSLLVDLPHQTVQPWFEG